MDKNTISKSLWDTANLLSGFAVVQTVTFTYACANTEFSSLINKFEIKIIISIIMLLITSMMANGIWWCAKNQVALMEGNSPESHIKIIRYAALGRIILVTLLLIPIFLALYAKQIGGLPFAI